MREVAPFVRAQVHQALALNPSDPRPRFLLGAIAVAHDYDWTAAESHFAASMNVPDVSVHARWIYSSLYLRGLGRFEESADETGRAVQQDPGYGRTIEHRDPFALVYSRASILEPLRQHYRWPQLAARMKLPAVAT
jgi:hypothetical protein